MSGLSIDSIQNVVTTRESMTESMEDEYVSRSLVFVV